MKSPHVHQHDGGRVHLLHAAVVALHGVCCGLPLVAGLAGVAASASIIGAHRYLHGWEVELLAVSGVLVAVGAYFEWRRRARGRPSTLFLLSVACLMLNVGIVASHRAEAAPRVAPASTPI